MSSDGSIRLSNCRALSVKIELQSRNDLLRFRQFITVSGMPYCFIGQKKKQITFKGSLSVSNCRFWSIHFYFVLWVTVLDWSLRVTFCLNAFYEVLWLPHDHALLKMLGSISLILCNWITQLLWFFLDQRAAIFPLNDNKKPLNGETIFVWVHLHPLNHASTVKWSCMEIYQDHHGRWRFSPYLSVEYLSVSDFRDH